MEYFGNQLKSS